MQTISFQTAKGEHLASAVLDGDGVVTTTAVSEGFQIVLSWPNEEDEIHTHEGNEIQVGDDVRSFDFESRDLKGEHACFVEGEVVAIGDFEEFPDCQRYKIRAARHIFRGEEIEHEEFIYTPLNGTPTSMGRETNGVEVI